MSDYLNIHSCESSELFHYLVWELTELDKGLGDSRRVVDCHVTAFVMAEQMLGLVVYIPDEDGTVGLVTVKTLSDL